MRFAPTPAEGLLWAAVRGGRVEGWRFRRQHVIAGYIVDFYCPALWLVVELDGPVHAGREREDARRDAHLAALGVRVVRVSNEEVLQRLPEMLEKLADRCALIAEQNSPPSPRSRGGKAGMGGHTSGGSRG